MLVGEAAGGVLPQLPPLDGHGVADAVGDLAAFQKGVIGVAVNVVLLNFPLDRFAGLHVQNYRSAVMCPHFYRFARQLVSVTEVLGTPRNVINSMRILRIVVVVLPGVDPGALYGVVEVLVAFAVVLVHIGHGHGPVVGVRDEVCSVSIIAVLMF